MSEIEDLKKQVSELTATVKALIEGKDPKALKPVKVDMTYLCPKDPNREKIIKAGGVVLPDDGPQHLRGWITDQKNIPAKHRTFDPNTGKQVEFTTYHSTATWICQTDGSEIHLDPYRV